MPNICSCAWFDFRESTAFKQQVKVIFNAIDIDGNGTLDFTEVYLGVVMLYMNLKGVGLFSDPPPKQHFKEMMETIDVDNR
jgi:Ca2+-binding EF-hand superfamily protein